MDLSPKVSYTKGRTIENKGTIFYYLVSHAILLSDLERERDLMGLAEDRTHDRYKIGPMGKMVKPKNPF